MTVPTSIVEIGFTSPSTGIYLHLDDTVRGKLDTATLAPVDLWVDVTGYTRAWSTRRGASRIEGPNLRYEAGTATITLDNSDRRFDPTNLAGPYVAGGVTQVEPMRAVRIRATWAGTTYAVWRGFADSWKTTYEGPNSSEVTLTCTDAFKVFAAYDRAAVGAVGAGEDAGARIDRILTSAAWPTGDRVTATGDTTLQATTLAGDALSELQLTAESELGEFHMDAEGRTYFRNRQAIVEDTRSNTSQGTFGDDPAEPRYADVELDYDDTTISNLVRITREGGAEQTVQGAASQTAYLVHVYDRSGLLMQTDAAALDYAGFVLHQAKDPELRFSTLTVNPQRDDTALYPQVLGRLMGDRITIRRRPPGGGALMQRDVFVRGVEHTATPATWSTRFVLQSATWFSFLILDNADLGMLDSNALGY